MRTLTMKQEAERDVIWDEITARMANSGYELLECYVNRIGKHWSGEALGIAIAQGSALNTMPCHYLLRWFYTEKHGWNGTVGIALPQLTLDKINQLVATTATSSAPQEVAS